jgi:4'-phosphopantetheinyl transferase
MPRHIEPRPGEVHLWWDAIDLASEHDDDLEVLFAGERARAAGFRFERDRRRFVARRVFARGILAGYLGITASQVPLRTSSQGKPELDAPSGISFSLSHSEGVTVMAVAAGGPVGVDIERVRPIADALEVAERFFARGEVAQLRSSPDDQAEAFLALWTRKESYLKATGAGLSVPLIGFDVSSPAGDDQVRPRGPQGPLPFVISRLHAQPGFIGAVTLAGRRMSMRSMMAGAPAC